MAKLTIRKGTEEEWKRSVQNPDDIVFLTDKALIKTQGQTYGAPLWEDE
jgi:hypothetical protein